MMAPLRTPPWILGESYHALPARPSAKLRVVMQEIVVIHSKAVFPHYNQAAWLPLV